MYNVLPILNIQKLTWNNSRSVLTCSNSQRTCGTRHEAPARSLGSLGSPSQAKRARVWVEILDPSFQHPTYGPHVLLRNRCVYHFTYAASMLKSYSSTVTKQCQYFNLLIEVEHIGMFRHIENPGPALCFLLRKADVKS